MTDENLIRTYEKALAVMAAGRPDNGRPLSGRSCMDLARNALFAAGVSWTNGEPVRPSNPVEKIEMGTR